MKLKVLALTAIMAAGLTCGFASAETGGNTGVRLLSGKGIGSTVTPIRGVKDKSDSAGSGFGQRRCDRKGP